MPEQPADLLDGVRYARGGALEKALEIFREVAASTDDPALRADALRNESDVHRTRCAWEDALAAARASAVEAEAAGSMELYAEALNAEAIVHQTRGDFAAAVPLLDRILEISQDERVQGLAHQNLGYIAATEGRLDEAEQAFERSERSFRAAGYDRGVAIALINRVQALLDRGDPAAAAELAREAAQAARDIGDLELVANATINHSEAIARLGDLTAAADLASAALGHFLVTENRYKQVECLRRLGELHRLRGDIDVAERCYRQGLELAREIGARVDVREIAARLAEIVES